MAKKVLGYIAGKPIDGFVYLMYADNGYYKIGHSYDPAHRIKAFKTKMPTKIVLLHAIPADDVRMAERELHNWFVSLKHKGIGDKLRT
jgi:predicted GIY-YIG superfamily endonuclease